MDYSKLTYHEMAREKPKDVYSDMVETAINILSGGKPDDISVFGSYTWNIQPYPSDVDLIQTVIECCTEAKVYDKMFKIIKYIIEQLDNQANNIIYLSEFKIGYDLRYFLSDEEGFYLGLNEDELIDEYNYKTQKWEPTSETFIDTIKRLKKDNLLTNDEFKILKNNFPVKNFKNDLNIENVLRKRFILRWNLNDLKKGYLKQNNKIFYLKDEIKYKNSQLKVDILLPVTDKYMEITNFYLLKVKNKKGKIDDMTYESELIDSLKEQITDLISADEPKYYKISKRLWTMTRSFYKNNKSHILLKRLRNLTKLLNNRIGVIYQIKAESETLLLLYEKMNISNITHKIIAGQLSDWANRISYALLDRQTENILVKMANILHKTQHILTVNKDKSELEKLNNKHMINYLEKFQDITNDIVNKFAKKELKRYDLLPIPNEYLTDYYLSFKQ